MANDSFFNTKEIDQLDALIVSLLIHNPRASLRDILKEIEKKVVPKDSKTT